MFADVEKKLMKKNILLFSRDSQCLQELINLIQLQNYRTLVMWALDCAKRTLVQFEVHVETRALGLPIYELTSIVFLPNSREY